MLIFLGNFEINQPVEILSASSSDEDLPTINLQKSNPVPVREPEVHQSSSSDTDTLPLSIDIVFYFGTESLQETFPNNIKCSVSMFMVFSFAFEFNLYK